MAHRGDTGVDLSLTAQLEFPGGVLATIDCSFEQPFRCSYELVGSRGVIEVPDAYLPPAEGKPIARLRTIGSGSDSSAVPTRFGRWNLRRSTSTRPWSIASRTRWPRASSFHRRRTVSLRCESSIELIASAGMTQARDDFTRAWHDPPIKDLGLQMAEPLALTLLAEHLGHDIDDGGPAQASTEKQVDQ